MFKKFLLSVLIVLFTINIFDFISPVFAQSTLYTESFEKLVTTLKTLFYSGRNLIFILSAFSLLWMFYGFVTKGAVDWKNLIWFIVALVLLASIGYVIDAVVFGVTDMTGFYEMTDDGLSDMKISNEVLRGSVYLENVGKW